MDVKEFGNELRRMLKSLGGEPSDRLICDGVSCTECPFNVYTKRTGRTELCILNFQHIDEVIDIVTAWSAEHPKKTNKDVLLEKFPNVMMDSNGTPKSCAFALGIIADCDSGISCSECWNEEYMEVNNN